MKINQEQSSNKKGITGLYHVKMMASIEMLVLFLLRDEGVQHTFKKHLTIKQCGLNCNFSCCFLTR